MIITRTPFRISFFGGGTDYPAYYKEHPGSVLAAAINKYSYIVIRPLNRLSGYKYRVVYSNTEIAHDTNEIVHPSVRSCLNYMKINEALEILYSGDLPARAGIGASSSFTVGMLKALHALKKMEIDKLNLAEAAIIVEQEIIKENVGSQDQTTAAFGGFNVIKFNQNKEKHIDVKPIKIDQEKANSLQDNLMLFFSGITRMASPLAGEIIQQIPRKKFELKAIYAMVDDATNVLLNGNDLDDFGRLLHEMWLVKKGLTQSTSSPLIDNIYQKARQAGALGGKLLGAGGGGFLVFYVRPDARERVKEALRLAQVPFSFDFTGSQVIFPN